MSYRINYKGFTLTELLAVIAVLGLLSILIVPRIGNVIDDSSKKIALENSNRIVNSMNQFYVRMKINNNVSPCSYNFSSGMSDCSDLSFDGGVPSSGVISVDLNGNVKGSLVFGKYVVLINNGIVSEPFVGLPLGTEYVFDYTGDVQEFVVPYSGTYELQVWGAQGGYRSNSSMGGKGGYAKGEINLEQGEKIFVYVGGTGNIGNGTGGYNGGGPRGGGLPGGGGATDMRIEGDTLYHRILVAGGGGSDGASNKPGYYGGGLTGGSATESYGSGGGGATQTTGGAGGSGSSNQGTFGQGGRGLSQSGGNAGAGGGGWYGGGGATPDGSGDDDRGAGGGSGFVKDASASLPDGYSVLYHSLVNTSLVSGNAEMPTHDGVSTTNGNSGNGYAKITFVEYGVQE